MPTISAIQSAQNGMSYERLRLEAAARNIAGASVPVPAGQAVSSWSVELTSNISARVRKQSAAEKLVRQPGHPLADAEGMVRYPAIEIVDEMTAMMAASRGYEANIRSFNLARGMMMSAMSIGSK